MSEVEITWVDSRRFVATDSTNHSVVLSTVSDGRGMKPSDLLLIALGSCMGVDVVGILEKKRQQVTGINIRVSGEQDADPPWTFRRIQVQFTIRGRNLSERAIAQAIELSENKYCSVRATIGDVAEVTSAFAIVEEERGADGSILEPSLETLLTPR